MENLENNFDEMLTDATEETAVQEEFHIPAEESIPSDTIPTDAEALDTDAAVLSLPEKKRTSPLKAAVAAILALALIGGSCGITYGVVNRKWENQTKLAASTIDQLNRKVESLQATVTNAAFHSSNMTLVGTNLAYEGMVTPREIYAKYVDSVVSVSSKVSSRSYTGQSVQGTSSGSGFILTEDGYVVTNYHVVENATAVTVVMSDKTEYEAKVVGSDTMNDVAVLKIEATGLPAVVVGSSSNLFVGDFVAAIGYPLGAESATMTYGIISGKDRKVTTDSTVINMLQTDAAINSGNSGGPLFNMYGEVVGITSAKYSGTSSSGASIESTSFAIPIDDVMNIIDDLRDYGYVTGAYLGVTVMDTDASAAAIYGLPTGAYVETTVEGGSADRAGVQPKDIIIALGDIDVSCVNDLTRTLRRFKPNDTTTITVIRAGERITLTITLDTKPKDLNAPVEKTEEMPQSGTYDEWFNYFFGGK